MKTPLFLFILLAAGSAIAAEEPKPKTPAPAAAPAAAAAAKPKAEPAASEPDAQTATGAADAPAAAAEPEEAHSTLITSDIGGRDLKFLTEALENGKVQLYLGDLARTKADSEQVKAVGEMLATAQAEENRKLVRLGAMKGITLSADELQAKKALDARLAKLSGPKLDKAVLEEIVTVNQRAVSTYEAGAQTQDDDIKAFVDQGLPLAREKLSLAGKMTGTAPRPAKPAAAPEVKAP